jgi:hypothetical protein
VKRWTGRIEALHALLIWAILAHLVFLDEQIGRLSDAIEEQIRCDRGADAPFRKLAELRCTIPGVQQRTAELLIAEIGVYMNEFPTAGHLASWAGQCPGSDQSAGKRRSGKTRKGSKHLNAALTDAAMAALRTNDSYLQALYRRKKLQLGHGRTRRCEALGALRMLAGALTRLALQRLPRRLLRDLERQPDASSRSSVSSPPEPVQLSRSSNRRTGSLIRARSLDPVPQRPRMTPGSRATSAIARPDARTIRTALSRKSGSTSCPCSAMSSLFVVDHSTIRGDDPPRGASRRRGLGPTGRWRRELGRPSPPLTSRDHPRLPGRSSPQRPGSSNLHSHSAC